MEPSVRVSKHCEVPDTSKFLVFGVEVITSYSKTILSRRFSDFKSFHRNLCLFAYVPFRNSTLLSIFPKLPGENQKVERLKVGLNEYMKGLAQILKFPEFNKYDPWIAYIRKFLSLENIERAQEGNAIIIQRWYRSLKEKPENEISNTMIEELLEGFLQKDSKLVESSLSNQNVLESLRRSSFSRYSNPKFRSSMIVSNGSVGENVRSLEIQLMPSPGSVLPVVTPSTLKVALATTVQDISYFVKSQTNCEQEIEICDKTQTLLSFYRIADLGRNICLYYQLPGENEIEHTENAWKLPIPEWVPLKNIEQCMRCKRSLNSSAAVNCRNCGKAVCKTCCSQLRWILKFGYTKDKVKVCDFCAYILPRNPDLYF